MANVKFFNGDTELTNIRPMNIKEFEALFPGVKGLRYDSYSRYVGGSKARVWTGSKWDDAPLPAERMVTYKSNPSRHECDARCYNAQGRTMNCECSCGGKNHGLGRFNCSAV